ncbi:septum formation family protein [Actinotalea sp. AC32]|nr:septum formation family protein [Actinotalea sp. AC32]
MTQEPPDPHGGWASPSGSWTPAPGPARQAPVPPDGGTEAPGATAYASNPPALAGPAPAGVDARPGDAEGLPGPVAGWYPQEAYYAPGWSAPVQPPMPRAPRDRRRVLVPLAAVLAVGLVVGGGLGARYWADTRTLGEVEGAVSAAPRQLTTGHCVETLPDDGALGRVTVVPCDARHEAEVVGVHTYDDDAWPGQDAVDREAGAACEMDTAQTEAGVRPVVWAPGRVAWQQGDREALCLAWSPEGAVGSWADGTAEAD